MAAWAFTAPGCGSRIVSRVPASDLIWSCSSNCSEPSNST